MNVLLSFQYCPVHQEWGYANLLCGLDSFAAFELSSLPQNKDHFQEKVVLGGAETKKDNKTEMPFNLKYALEKNNGSYMLQKI